DVKILGLAGPVAPQRHFEAAAGGPAGIGVSLAWLAWHARLDVAEGEAAGHVGHDPVEAEPKPAAHGGEPGNLGLAARRTVSVRGALDVAPVEIAFEAVDELSGLPVEAEGAAGESALDVEIPSRVPFGSAPGEAAVRTEIEPGPVVDRGIGRWCLEDGG